LSEDKLYEGKELDDTGLIYFGARYYNPNKRIMIMPDSLIPNVYDSQQLSLTFFYIQITYCIYHGPYTLE